MAESAYGNAAGGGENGNRDGEFSSPFLIALEKLSNLIASKISELTRQSDRIKEMGTFDLWRDSKVPDRDRGFYNFVSLVTCSNKIDISNDIEKYKTFYSETKTTVDELRQAARENSLEEEDISRLCDRISVMIQEAESGMAATNSLIVYEMDKDFIGFQEDLIKMIKRVECLALRQRLQQVIPVWNQTLTENYELRREIQEAREYSRGMREKLDNIKAVNEEMDQDNEVLLEQNKVISDMLRESLDKP